MPMMWLNKSVTTINATLQLFDIYRYRFILYVYECVSDTNCVDYLFLFFVIILFVKIVMCMTVCIVLINLTYNLIIRKYKGFVTCVCILIML